MATTTSEYGLVQTQAPIELPISVSDVKSALRIDLDIDDTLIAQQIATAVDTCERRMDRQLCPAEWTLYLDAFPDIIRLPRPPLQSVTRILYVDSDSVTQTMDTADYAVRSGREPAIVQPAYGESWPTPLPQPDAIQVVYRSGYTDAAAVPQAIKTAIIMHIALLRGDTPQLGMSEDACRLRRDELLEQYRHGWRFG